ncbi:LamG domain-containing protein [Jiulongibacter sediminis]|uniref:LamG domain-containing protein n=1 Tax=Jiulongibacter sediminis TaxID=1605367 RepID=UPI0026EA0F54|nr:LamG domain-containing protein [Jiulongibacter sediminis]
MQQVSTLLLLLFLAYSPVSLSQNYALKFDGVDDFLELENSSFQIESDQNFTVSFWIQLSNSTKPDVEKQYLFLKETGEQHPLKIWIDTRVDDPDRFKIKVSRFDGEYSPSLTSSATINDGQWHLIALVKNQRMLLFYLDGTMDAYVRDNTNGILAGQSPARIGGADEAYFTGALDNLSFRNQALDAAAVKSEFVNGNNRSDDQILFDFDSKETNVISSSAGQGQLIMKNFEEGAFIEGLPDFQEGGSTGWWAELTRAYENYRNGEPVNLSSRFMWQTIFMLLGAAAFSYGVFRWILFQRQKTAREREEKIQTELSSKKKELVSQTLHLVNKNAVLNDLKEDLTNYQKASEGSIKEINKIIRNLKMENASEANWEVFKSQFMEMHDGFDRKLREKNQSITDNEIRLAALVKMKLSNKEIAEMLNVQPESVKKSKFRLKKKLSLEGVKDLNVFLEGL